MNPIRRRKIRVKRRQILRRTRNYISNITAINAINNSNNIVIVERVHDQNIATKSESIISNEEPVFSDTEIDPNKNNNNNNILEQQNTSIQNTEPEQRNTTIPNHELENGVVIHPISESENQSLEKTLKGWALECRPNISHVDKLLNVLKKFPLGNSLPRTYETLVKTPRNLILKNVLPGKYFHVGIQFSMKNILQFHAPLSLNGPLLLDVNVDGLPLYKSSATQFWPILGRISNISGSKPFVIGIYVGKKKLASVEEYLEDFINEMDDLIETGFYFNGVHLNVKLRAFICDSPAKAFIKHIKGHNAYYGCTICIQSGIYDNKRMSFPEIDSTLRTNLGFRNRIHEEHHINDGENVSPLERLDIDMIYDFPLDYMHLLLLGVMKKLFLIWTSGDLRVRMSGHLQNLITKMLKEISETQSRSFSRPSRSLEFLKFWKATEFRTFLLYTGPIILKNVLPPELYNNFLLLHVATKMCMKEDYFHHLEIANTLFRSFVTSFEECYGSSLISSNVHNVVHLVHFVKKFGILDSFSAFPFETTLGQIKPLIKKYKQELQQVAKRLIEFGGILEKVNQKYNSIILEHEYPPKSRRFKQMRMRDSIFTNDDKDAWFLSVNLKIVRIRFFEKNDSNVIINGEELTSHYQNIYDVPIESRKLECFGTVNLNSINKCYMISDIKCKLLYFTLTYCTDVKHFFLGL